MTIQTYRMPTVTAVGTAGTTATGTETSTRPLSGMLKSIKVVQGNTPHANTDITITMTDGVTTRTLLTLTNNNTASAWYNTRAPATNEAGAALTFDATQPVPVELPLDGTITVTVAQGGSAATCDVTIVYDDLRR